MTNVETKELVACAPSQKTDAAVVEIHTGCADT
jgi:hypothetical protein